MPRESTGDTLKRLRGLQSASETWKKKREATRHEKIKAAGTRSHGFHRGIDLSGPDPHSFIPHGTGHVELSAEALAEQERVNALEHPTLTGRLLGDPLPGRSALDKRQPRVVVSNQETP